MRIRVQTAGTADATHLMRAAIASVLSGMPMCAWTGDISGPWMLMAFSGLGIALVCMLRHSVPAVLRPSGFLPGRAGSRTAPVPPTL